MEPAVVGNQTIDLHGIAEVLPVLDVPVGVAPIVAHFADGAGADAGGEVRLVMAAPWHEREVESRRRQEQDARTRAGAAIPMSGVAEGLRALLDLVRGALVLTENNVSPGLTELVVGSFGTFAYTGRAPGVITGTETPFPSPDREVLRPGEGRCPRRQPSAPRPTSGQGSLSVPAGFVSFGARSALSAV